MSQVKTLKRIFSKAFCQHALAFALASRRLILTPLVLVTVSVFLLRVIETLATPSQTGVVVNNTLWTKLIIITICMLGSGTTLLVGLFMSVWRLCIITRAYLMTPFEVSTVPKREVFAKAIKEADLTLNHNKGNLTLKILCISLLQVPPLILLMAAISILLAPLAAGILNGMSGDAMVAMPPEYFALVDQARIPAVIIAVLSLVMLNSMVITGGAKATLPNLSVARSVFDSLKLSITHCGLITLLSIPLFIISTFLQQPDILIQLNALARVPGLTEPPWVIAGRKLWEILLNQYLVPVSAAIMLETIRLECLPKSVPGATLSMEPLALGEQSEISMAAPKEDVEVVEKEDAAENVEVVEKVEVTENTEVVEKIEVAEKEDASPESDK